MRKKICLLKWLVILTYGVCNRNKTSEITLPKGPISHCKKDMCINKVKTTGFSYFSIGNNSILYHVPMGSYLSKLFFFFQIKVENIQLKYPKLIFKYSFERPMFLREKKNITPWISNVRETKLNKDALKTKQKHG